MVFNLRFIFWSVDSLVLLIGVVVAQESLGALSKCGEGEEMGRFQCVPYYNCDKMTWTVTVVPEVDGSNKISSRSYLERNRCDHYLDVCCGVSNIAQNYKRNNNSYYDALQNSTTWPCGFFNKTEAELLNSIDNSVNVYPWLVMIHNDEKILCEGSIVTPSVVLTSANCVLNEKKTSIEADKLIIKIGAWKLHSIKKTKSKVKRIQERKVKNIILHEHFLASTLYNNLALLILDKDLEENKYVGSVCVTENQKNYNKDCFIKAEFDNDTRDQNKNAINQSLTKSQDACQENLRKTSLESEFILHRSFKCASEKIPCTNKPLVYEGTPLICPGSLYDSTVYQVGLLSWQYGCNPTSNDGYNIFSDISAKWIEAKLNELGTRQDKGNLK